MQNLKLVSEDERRRLFEFGEGEWKIAKYVEVKDDCMIGGHYHKKKDECFILIKGEMKAVINGFQQIVKAPDVVDVPRGTLHTFYIKAGSKLIGLCSELHNSKDDYSIINK